MSPIVYLISGANRGIGLGFVNQLVDRENVVVFAGARNPSEATELQALAQKFPGKVNIVKLTSCDESENEAAVTEVKKIAGKLDVVIANAGISNFYGPLLEAPIEQIRNHFEINVIGVLVLFQAAYPLLKESPLAKFVPISSGAGSIADGAAMPALTGTYGSSKAALNYITRKIHFESPEIVTFPITPGPVNTDMAQSAKENDAWLNTVKFQTVEDSVKGMLRLIDNATRDKNGGQFFDWSGAVRKW